MVVPTISAVSPNPVKNGEVLTVTGTDLDLISKVTFGGAKAGEIIEGGTAKEIKVKVPKDAKDGVTFGTLANKNVEFAELKMVVPKVTAYSPTPAPAGANVKLQGTDLDLVVSVTFTDNLVVPVTPDKATELTVTIPITAVSGVVVLTTVNGDKINSPELAIISPTFAFLLSPPGSDAEIHAGELLVVEIGNQDKLTDVQVNGKSTQYILDGSKLYILIPSNASGNCTLKLVSSNGEASYTIPVIAAGSYEVVIWEGMVDIDWGSNKVYVPAEGFNDIPVGSVLTFHFQQKDAWGQVQINNGKWSVIPGLGVNGYLKTGEVGDKSVTTFENELTKEVLDNIINNQEWGNGLILQGSDWIMTKITIKVQTPVGVELWSGSVGPIGWSGSDLVGPIDTDLLAAGKTLGIDYIVNSGGGQMEVMAGSWWTGLEGWTAMNNGDRYIRSCDASETNIEFVITQTDINNIKQQGSKLLICGNDVTIKRVYVK